MNQCAIGRSRVGQGAPPLENHKNIGFLSNTGPDPLKNYKASVGPSSAFKCCFAGGPMMAHL